MVLGWSKSKLKFNELLFKTSFPPSVLVSAKTEVNHNFFPNKLAELRLCEVFVFGTHPIDDEKKKNQALMGIKPANIHFDARGLQLCCYCCQNVSKETA